MKGSWSRLRQCLAIVLLPIALFLAACDSDSTEPRLPEYSEVAVVMNSIERSLSIIPIDEPGSAFTIGRSEEHTSELQSRGHLVCRLLLEKKNVICVTSFPSNSNNGHIVPAHPFGMLHTTSRACI